MKKETVFIYNLHSQPKRLVTAAWAELNEFGRGAEGRGGQPGVYLAGRVPEVPLSGLNTFWSSGSLI